MSRRCATIEPSVIRIVHSQELELHHYMLFAHGSDLCHDLELRHAMANCFEALLGALYLDGGIDVADRVFSRTYFAKNKPWLDVWTNYPLHPLQEQEPHGDRKWISTFPVLQVCKRDECGPSWYDCVRARVGTAS